MSNIKELKNLLNNFSEISLRSLEEIDELIDCQSVSKGVFLKTGQASKDEYFIFSGYGRLYATTDEGIATTIAFLTPNSIAPPLKTRVSNTKSIVSIEAYTEIILGKIDSRAFFELCLRNPEIMALGTKMMEQSLIEKSEKEIALATLKGNARLSFLRTKYPSIENHVSHQHIASYLGITNVSLSRLRAKQQNNL